jgi:hypothetical protein
MKEAVRRSGGQTVRGWAWGATVAVLVLTVWPSVRLSAQSTSITIYQDGRVTVRRALPVSVARGTSTVAADLGVRQFDAATFAVLDSGVTLRAVRVSEATGQDGSLLRSLGREVEFQVGSDTAPRYVRGTLLSLTPPTLRLDGRVRYGFPGIPVFPDSLVQLAPRVELTVEATRAVSPLRVLFLSGGLNWQAAYTLVLPRATAGTAAVAGHALIHNGGMVALRGAEVQLLAGDVRRVAGPRMRGPEPLMAAMAAREGDAGPPAEESVGETHVYTLPGTVDFVPGQSQSVALFPAATAGIETAYLLRGNTPGPMGQWPEGMVDLHPDVEVTVRRPTATPFGAAPLPAGVVRAFGPDSAGRLQLLGETPIGHTAPGSDVKVVTGTAFDITAIRVQSSFERVSQREATSAYRVVLRNAKREGVVVQVYDQFPGSWELLSSTVPGERVTASSVRFALPVPAGGEATLNYRVRVRW